MLLDALPGELVGWVSSRNARSRCQFRQCARPFDRGGFLRKFVQCGGQLSERWQG